MTKVEQLKGHLDSLGFGVLGAPYPNEIDLCAIISKFGLEPTLEEVSKVNANAVTRCENVKVLTEIIDGFQRKLGVVISPSVQMYTKLLKHVSNGEVEDVIEKLAVLAQIKQADPKAHRDELLSTRLGSLTLREALETEGCGMVYDFPDNDALCKLINKYPDGISPAQIAKEFPLDAKRFTGYKAIMRASAQLPLDTFRLLQIHDRDVMTSRVERYLDLVNEGVGEDVAVLQIVKAAGAQAVLEESRKLGFCKEWGTELPIDKLHDVAVIGLKSKRLSEVLGVEGIKRACAVMYITMLYEKELPKTDFSMSEKQMLIKWHMDGDIKSIARAFKRKEHNLDDEEDNISKTLKLARIEAKKYGIEKAYGTALPDSKLLELYEHGFDTKEGEVLLSTKFKARCKAVREIKTLFAKLKEEDDISVTFESAVYKGFVKTHVEKGYTACAGEVTRAVTNAANAFKGTTWDKGFGDIFKDLGFDKDTFSKKLSDNLAKNATKKAQRPKAVPLTVPAIHKALNAKVIGQTEAKRAIAHSVYILSLLAAATRNATTRAVEVPNILLRGPSGCGKTLIASQIAKLLKWKMVKIDCSQITASGYYGDSLSQKLGDISEKVVFLDEIDKLIGGEDDKSTKASTESVQYELLTYLEKQYSNVNCLFVAAGSFANTTKELIPELRGRLPVVCNLAKPSSDDFVNGFKTYHLKKLKAIATLVAPTMKIEFKPEVSETVGHLAYAVAETTPIGYRALDSFTHEISIHLSHDLSEGKEIVIDNAYITSIFK